MSEVKVKLESNPKLESVSKLFSDPMPGTARAVYVTIPASLAYDFGRMQEVTKVVLGKLGCSPCHSGFDLRYIHQNDFRFNEKGELLQF